MALFTVIYIYITVKIVKAPIIFVERVAANDLSISVVVLKICNSRIANLNLRGL
ncbi:hypothetical protein IMSAG192_01416 [Muribaculaceae bacterium]|nr:hypothetical protein IMSAG192_01416 [Muribaculaceae bacterium]